MLKRKWWIYTVLVIVIVYLMGPRPPEPVLSASLPVVPSADSLEAFINHEESMHKVKPDNEARIVWADDSAKNITDYSILYLHGFSASQGEGDPVHKYIAKKYHCNLYLARLADHDIDTTEKLVNFTTEKYWESAKEAYAIASRLGKKVIVIGTSTGGTLALMLAADYPEIYSIILLSPNIEIFDKHAWLLNNPWGLQIARLVTGSNYINSEDTRPIYKQYWSYGYRIESLVQLEELLESQMTTSLFEKVKQPVLMLYYYKDNIHQDSVVKVEAMQNMFAHLGTPSKSKRAVAIPNAGNHVIGSYIKSHDVESVEREIEKFMDDVLKIKR